MAPGRSGCDLKNVIFNLVLLIGLFRSSYDNVLRWMPQDLTDDKSTLVQVMAWCRQATSHYLNQCWQRSPTPYDVTWPRWVKSSISSMYHFVCGETDMGKIGHNKTGIKRHKAQTVNIISGIKCIFHPGHSQFDFDLFLFADIDILFSWWIPWWRHQMETFSALLAICAGNSPVPGEFPAQRPVTRSFDVLFDLHLNTRLSKQWWAWWFETPSCPLWRHRNDFIYSLFCHVSATSSARHITSYSNTYYETRSYANAYGLPAFVYQCTPNHMD